MAEVKYDIINPYVLPGLLKDTVIKFKPVITRGKLDEIIEAVSEATGIEVDQIRGKKRTTPIATARQIYCLLGRRYSNSTLKQIGASLGGRDHTTIMNATRAVSNYIDTDKTLRDMVRVIEGKII